MRKGMVREILAQAKTRDKDGPAPDVQIAEQVAVETQHLPLKSLGRRGRRVILKKVRQHMVLVEQPKQQSKGEGA
jgi:hypothetical protein